ncbi:hypothetical protein FOCC_FOCC008195 [Frankliniella occidentalis]|nr:hypothetical protein FOCC_FOCC008195 [Frankliniella occidentalis]
MDVVPDRTRVLLALIVSGVIVVALHLRRRIEDHLRHRGRGRGRRRWWVRPVNRRREQQGLYHNLFAETVVEDHEEFFDACRMWPEQFEWLHAQVAPFLIKYSRRIPLSPRHRLAMTLRYLAQGGTVKSLHDQFRVGRSTCHKVIGETCTAIWQALQPIYLPQPTQEMWLSNASRFLERWQMPHCVGAVDGRHMRVKAPPNTGSKYWNYEKFFSMVLLAVCDDAYKFVVVDVGQYGKFK